MWTEPAKPSPKVRDIAQIAGILILTFTLTLVAYVLVFQAESPTSVSAGVSPATQPVGERGATIFKAFLGMAASINARHDAAAAAVSQPPNANPGLRSQLQRRDIDAMRLHDIDTLYSGQFRSRFSQSLDAAAAVPLLDGYFGINVARPDGSIDWQATLRQRNAFIASKPSTDRDVIDSFNLPAVRPANEECYLSLGDDGGAKTPCNFRNKPTP